MSPPHSDRATPTDDGHHVVIDGWRWRAIDPHIPAPFHSELVAELQGRGVVEVRQAGVRVASRDEAHGPLRIARGRNSPPEPGDATVTRAGRNRHRAQGSVRNSDAPWTAPPTHPGWNATTRGHHAHTPIRTDARG